MRKSKKMLSIILSVIIMLGIVPAGMLTVNATSKTVDEAIAWVKSKCGTGIDYDGYYGCQCVDLIMAYYNFLGVSPSSGNGADYAWNTLPSGWTRVAGGTPQKGDILVYTNDTYGHVAIFESTYSHYHQNFNYHSYVENVTISYNWTNSCYWGYIRPNFYSHSHSYSNSVTKQPTCTENGVRTYTCSCGSSYTETITKLGHNYIPVVTEPTCTAEGYTTYTCSRCTDSYVSDITSPADHSYILEDTCLYSNNTASINYYCSSCNNHFEKNLNVVNGKTEFIEEKICGLYNDSTEEKMQYRFSKKDIKTSTANTMDGYEFDRTEYSNYGSWSGWTTGYRSSDELTDVQSATIYLWYAYICPNCGCHDPFKGDCSRCGYYLTDVHWWQMWSDRPFSEGNYYSANKTVTYFTDYYNLYSASDHSPEAGYRYRTRTKTNYFYKWSEFSEWQDEEIVADEKTIVETRTQYSYDLLNGVTAICGDANADGDVDAEDLAMLKKSLLAGDEYDCFLDVNGDNVIDILDLVRYKMHLANSNLLLCCKLKKITKADCYQ